ncbi:hypothetical protein BGZ54_004863 [Gamsiella multidivaricata]|nr:hypothetical protein BGZ54_004863 [Gamsiella multidivaricata]
MGNVSSKPSTDTPLSASIPTSPSSQVTFDFKTTSPSTTLAPQAAPTPTRSSFSVESPSKKERRHIQHQRSFSFSVRPIASRSQHSDSGNSTGKSQDEVVLARNSTNSKADSAKDTNTSTNTSTNTNTNPASTESLADLKTARAENDEAMNSSVPTALLLDKPLPASPLLRPPTPPPKDRFPQKTVQLLLSPDKALAFAETIHDNRQKDLATKISRSSSLSQQSVHSQSSLSDKSVVSSSSGSSSGGSANSNGSRSDNSARTATTPTTSVSGGTIESVGQLSLQRFPTGESEYKVKSSSKFRQSHGTQAKAPRATSTVSSSSARSSSGSSGFKFSKPNLSFKPLLYSNGNDSKNQQHLYQHHNSSNPSASPNGYPHQALDAFANSPFPTILMTIQLPQSLLDKYVVDQESFRHGKGIWGIGRYSWTITVLSRSNGKKYVIKRVSKSLLPPSAYYHYPTTAHRLCTCPACKSSREQLLLSGQLDQKELENMQEVLIIENKGKKELPQLPPSSPQLQPSKLQSNRLLSTSSISSSATKDPKDKDKWRSFNLYSVHNVSMPNQQGKSLTFSANSSAQSTPANSRPSTPSPSPLRLCSNPSNGSVKVHSRSHSHHVSSATQSSHYPLLPSATPLSWPYKDSDPMVPQSPNRIITTSDLSHGPHLTTQPPADIFSEHASARSSKSALKSLGSSHGRKRRPALKRHASTPNLSRPLTGLDLLEDDPLKVDQLRQLTRLNTIDWHPQDGKNHRYQHNANPFNLGADRRLQDFPLPTSGTAKETISNHEEGKKLGSSSRPSVDLEKKVDPFDTNGGEFRHLEPESPRSTKAPAPQGFTPPQHALPMELVLLQTYNDSDHLPEHHEWTQDQDYWYYVTKAHGVRRRKLKKVSTWWLDMGSLGSVIMSGSSSSSTEPIATGPIYNMGHATGTSSPHMSSPLSSELQLSNGQSSGRQTPNQESLSSQISNGGAHYSPSVNATMKRQGSPRNSHMGKYFYVDWDEYTSL